MKDFTTLTPELIAMVGDWHGDIPWALKAVECAREVGAELIISVGDFGFWPRFEEGQRFLMALEEALAEAGISLWWVDGNHEDHAVLGKLPLAANGLRPISHHISHIPRGFRWEWDGTVWMGLGGAVSVDQETRVPQVDWFPAERISEQDATHASRPGSVTVMVTHEGVVGAAPLDMKLSRKTGFDPLVLLDANLTRERLTEVVEAVKPLYLFHGHHHMAYSAEVGPTLVRGLDCNNSTLAENMVFVDSFGCRAL